MGLAQPVGDQTQNAEPRTAIAELMDKANAARAHFDATDQDTLHGAVRALAWSLYKPENARRLAEHAVESIGLGDVDSKITKNTRKTFGTLRDLLRTRSCGIIEEDPAKGIVKYAKPVGVVGAITPSTNPAATPVNKAMMALNGGNAIIIAPSPAAWDTTNATVEAMRAELEVIGLPADLVQILPAPVSRELTTELMRQCDLVVCTGSQNNVKGAYSSGTPAHGVGAGNVPVIIDADADLADAAEKITASKIFDCATSCSSENALFILDAVYDEAISALKEAGGYMASDNERAAIIDNLWVDGKLNRHLIARPTDALIEGCGLSEEARGSKFIMVEEAGIGPDYPLSGEKLSLVLTIYRVDDFADAKTRVNDYAENEGKGHSVGIHTNTPAHAEELARDMETVRVLVNQAHTFGNGGGFNNGLPFTLSMGCGSWQGNSLSENLNWRCFINVTHLVTTIPEDKPSDAELFGPHWEKIGLHQSEKANG